MLATLEKNGPNQMPDEAPKAPKSGVGEWLTEARKSRGLSQDQVAERAGITQEYVSGIERGARNPSRKVIAALSKALTPEGADPDHAERLMQEGLRASVGLAGRDHSTDRQGGADISREESSPYRMRPDGAFELVLPEDDDEDFTEDPETWPQEFQDIMNYSRDLTPAQRRYIFRLWREQVKPHAQIARDMRSLTSKNPDA